MKITLRNLRVVLTRFKTASALNIIGLSIAFAAFMVIMIQVSYEQNFDTSYPNSDRIYRVEMRMDSTQLTPLMSRPLVDMCLGSSPAIEHGALIACVSRDRYVQVEKSGSKVGFNEPMAEVYPDIVNVFGYEFIDGTGDAIQNPNRVLIPESMAIRLYGTSLAAGQTINIEVDQQNRSCEVGGVYRDLPASSSIGNTILMPVDDFAKGDWGSSDFYLYLKLVQGASPEDVTTAINTAYADVEMPDWAQRLRGLATSLVPVTDLYYLQGRVYDLSPKGDRDTTDMLISIAILIIAVASINFVNFSTSLIPMRIKSINIQKVLGSPVPTLRRVMVCEAIGISLIAMMFSLLWVDLASRAGLSQWVSGSISVEDNWPIVALTALLSLVVGLLAGLYPAHYATSFAPALVLKGSFGLSGSGRILRKGLIGFQFVVSIGLITASLFMHLQNSYIRSFKTGMNTEQVAMVKISKAMATDRNTVTNRLKSNPMIEDVAYGATFVGASDTYTQFGRDFIGIDGMIQFTAINVSHNFCSLMGLSVEDGRDFTITDEQSDGIRYMFNQKAKSAYGLSTESQSEGNPVVGFVKDFNYASLRSSIEPMALYIDNKGILDCTYIKITGDPYAAADQIRTAFKELDPTYPISVSFYDQVFDHLYQKERKTTALITIFSTLAIVLALMGVFGLVLFETQYRRKEIGVRKVHGASVSQILGLFGRSFVWVVLICFLIAAPLAWWGVDQWLQNFPYRTQLYWWVFALALLIVLLITLTTIITQSWRAATTNPIKSLKSE